MTSEDPQWYRDHILKTVAVRWFPSRYFAYIALVFYKQNYIRLDKNKKKRSSNFTSSGI